MEELFAELNWGLLVIAPRKERVEKVKAQARKKVEFLQYLKLEDLRKGDPATCTR